MDETPVSLMQENFVSRIKTDSSGGLFPSKTRREEAREEEYSIWASKAIQWRG